MALYDSIVLEIQGGVLSTVLRATDLLTAERKVTLSRKNEVGEYYRVGFHFYKESSIKTELANNAEGTGNAVLKGGAAKYQRVSEGLYQVLGLGEQEELIDSHVEQKPVARASQNGTPEEGYATYLESQPFQIFDRRRKCFHPAAPVIGFDARIAAYFWPDPETSYSDTEFLLNGYIERARALLTDLDSQASGVLQLFTEICAWGGVRLPTDDPQVVVSNLKLAKAPATDAPAAMNSAWTKLYAFFYPDEFVIYDSRVATALVSIAERVLENDAVDELRKSYPSLGVVAGRGGTRPRENRLRWKNAYRSWGAQLDANCLAKKILAELNRRSGAAYSLRQLEAALFMEGY